MKKMTYPTSKQLLDREGIDSFVIEKLTPTITMLRELVDYGVDLIDKCAQQGRTLTDLVITAHFFKHAVTMLDAVEIQLSRGAVFSASVSARSMLESYIYLAWILKQDTEIRGRQFYVWHLRQQRMWIRRLIPGTSENEHFKKHTNSLSDMKDPAKKALLDAEIKKQDAAIFDILANPENSSINSAFDRFKGKKRFDVAWYFPSGANSIRDIAIKLNLDTEYDIFYAQFSDISHVGAFTRHVKFDGTAVIFEPIRSPEGIRSEVTLVASLAFCVYRLIITKFFPHDMQSFNNAYITRWRSRFLSVPECVVKNMTEER